MRHEFHGDKVTRTFHCVREHLNEEWFDLYKGYQEMYGYCPVIHEWSQEHIVMDKVPGVQLKFEELFNFEDRFKAFHTIHKNYFDIVSSFYEYSSIRGVGFWHDLTHDEHTFVNPVDYSLMIIAPEEFIIRPFVDITEIDQPGFLKYASRHVRTHTPNARNFTSYVQRSK